MIYELFLKHFISLIPFLSISIFMFGCSNKPVEKEMKMPMLFNTREEAEKEAYKFGCEGTHQWGINGCQTVCTKITIKMSILSFQFSINSKSF